MIGLSRSLLGRALPALAYDTEQVSRSPRKVRALVTEVARRERPTRVLQLGAGNGALTRGVVRAMGPDDGLVVLAVRPGAATALRNRLRTDAELQATADRIEVVEGDLRRLDDATGPGAFDVVVCTLPFNSLPVGVCQDVFSFVRRRLRPGGVVSWAEYPPWRDLEEWIRGVLGREMPRAAFLRHLLSTYGVRRDLVLGVPPTWVHHARFTTGDKLAAETLLPAHQPASVRLGPFGRVERTGLLPAAGGGLLTVSALGGGLAGLDLLARLRGKRLEPGRPWWLVAGPAVASLMMWVARDPDRELPTDAGAIIAPCDGEVLSAGVVDGVPEVGPGKWARVAIGRPVFGTITDRAPVAGRISEVRRDGGCCTTVIQTRRGELLVAHRSKVPAIGVVMRHRANALLARGERMGLTRVGGTTELYVPAADGYPVVLPGQVVRGGETVVSRYHA